MTDETYTCAGCAGEVPVVEAVWLPESVRMNDKATDAKPYCSKDCYQARVAEAVKAKEGADGK